MDHMANSHAQTFIKTLSFINASGALSAIWLQTVSETLGYRYKSIPFHDFAKHQNQWQNVLDDAGKLFVIPWTLSFMDTFAFNLKTKSTQNLMESL